MAKEKFIVKAIRFIFTFITGDYTRKTVAVALPMILLDFCFAALAGGVAILYLSPWLGMMCVYYMFLTIMKTRLIYRAGRGLFSKSKKYSDGANLKSFAKWLFFMDLLLLVAIFFMTRRGVTHEYPGFLVYVMAIYVVYKVAAALFNLFRASRAGSILAMEIRCIGIVEALVSVLALESALNYAYGNRYQICSVETIFKTGIATFVVIMIMVVIARVRGRASLLKQ